MDAAAVGTEAGDEMKVDAVAVQEEPAAESTEPKVEAAAEVEAAEAEAETADGAAAEEAPAAGVSGSAAPKRQREPVKLGFKEFKSGNEACAYFKNIMNMAPKNINLNEYEAKVLTDLLQRGHPNAEKKIGAGLLGFQVREFNDSGALAFYVVRKDNTSEDFSYLKCCAALFDDVAGTAPGRGGGKKHQGERSGGAGGSGGGRGRGGRGRGNGRGRGFSRGRGRK